MTKTITIKERLKKHSLLGATVAAVTASLCCVGPLVLLMLGVSGAWISYLMILEPIRPLFIGVTLLFLGLAFWKLYIQPTRCHTNSTCAKPHTLRIQRVLFWLISIMLLVLLAFPWYAFLFY